MNPVAVIYGFHPVSEALRRRPQEVEEVWLAGRTSNPRHRQIEELCRRYGIPCQQMPESRLRDLLGGNRHHNGIGAVVKPPSQDQLEVYPAGDLDLRVLVEDVQDPRNVGALLRVCEGAGVGEVLIRDRGSAPFSPAVTKVSAGASEWLQMERVVNSAQQIERLKQGGFWVYGADAAGKPAWEVDLTGRVLLCFGGEQKGLRQQTRERCDLLIGLPMGGRVSSLNLATAAAALLFEAVRQRRLARSRSPD